jgi:succinate dehydrogenase / fumarate reductase membrane anchor subunit
MSMRSPLGQARGSGSTDHGVQHWLAERFGAIALVPLGLWFIYSLLGLVGADYATYQAWQNQPGNLILTILFLLALFHHAHLGLTVVLEDYIQPEWLKNLSVIILKYTAFLLCMACILSALRVTFSA